MILKGSYYISILYIQRGLYYVNYINIRLTKHIKMGSIFTSLFQRIFSKRDIRILMVGLDAAGKTTILYKLKLGEIVTTIPTIGFNVETIEYKNINFTVWDIGGQTQIRLLWKHYYQNTQGIIFVVDSSDTERVQEAREEIEKLLAEEDLKGAALLVLANKQDISGALPPADVATQLGLTRIKGTPWHIQGACGQLEKAYMKD